MRQVVADYGKGGIGFWGPLSARKNRRPGYSDQVFGHPHRFRALQIAGGQGAGVTVRSLVRRIKGVRKSLLGKLNFAWRVIPMGWVFCRRLSMATAGVSSPLHFVRLSSAS